MATWDIQKGEDKVCPQCESVYSVTHHQVPVKDIDSANCLVCDFELARWKSTRYPTFQLKARGRWPRPEIATGN
jgi:hypothetical protein